MTKNWLGDAICDICEADCTKEKYFVDAPTKQGPWALMCPKRYLRHGIKFGQKYGPDKVKIEDLHA